MDFVGLIRSVFALAIVLGLILGLAWALRRYAPQLMARMTAPRSRRRLEVVETLVLDPARRLVLVRLDAQERLILLGEGHELGSPSGAGAFSATHAASKGAAQEDDDPGRELFQ